VRVAAGGDADLPGPFQEQSVDGRCLEVLILGRYNNGKAKVQAVLNHQWQHFKCSIRRFTAPEAKKRTTSPSSTSPPAACPPLSKTTHCWRWPCQPPNGIDTLKKDDCFTSPLPEPDDPVGDGTGRGTARYRPN